MIVHTEGQPLCVHNLQEGNYKFVNGQFVKEE
jgi:hypothetical protein